MHRIGTMKQDILEKNVDMLLERLRLEEQDRRNRALRERMATPRSTAEMLAYLSSFEGLRGKHNPVPQGENAQFSQKAAFIV